MLSTHGSSWMQDEMNAMHVALYLALYRMSRRSWLSSGKWACQTRGLACGYHALAAQLAEPQSSALEGCIGAAMFGFPEAYGNLV